MTRVFLEFCADKAEDYKDKAVADLLSDTITEKLQAEYRTRIWCLTELQSLTVADMKALYGIEDKPQEKATETA